MTTTTQMNKQSNKKLAIYILSTIITISSFFFIQSCTNPFAPGLAKDVTDENALGNQKTIEGLFKNFRYSYVFKDTLVYGNMLHNEFVFVYRDYDQGVDKSWGRDEDMIATNGLFSASQSLDLIWNEVLVSIGDSVLMDISRGFTLTVVFNSSDQIRVQGRASFRLARESDHNEWKILRWRDESNF